VAQARPWHTGAFGPVDGLGCGDQAGIAYTCDIEQRWMIFALFLTVQFMNFRKGIEKPLRRKIEFAVTQLN
jgi:hypothetical protein